MSGPGKLGLIMGFIELWQQRFYYWELLRVAPSESLDYLDRLFDAGSRSYDVFGRVWLQGDEKDFKRSSRRPKSFRGVET